MAGSALTWDSDLDDIWIFWFDFDGSQPTQIPGGSCETRGRQGIQSGVGVNLAQRARSLLNTPVWDLLVAPEKVISVLVSDI